MTVRARHVGAPPEDVWAVLADGWLYPAWVVGAAAMRAVDAHWPDRGAQLHHTVGAWPVLLEDTTTVLESVPVQLLRVRARGWPAGEAQVTLEVEPADGGSRVTMTEEPVAGPGRFVPRALQHAVLARRNDETLDRLCHLAVGRAGA